MVPAQDYKHVPEEENVLKEQTEQQIATNSCAETPGYIYTDICMRVLE